MKDLLLKGVFVVAGLFLPLTSHAINVDSLARAEAKEFGHLPKQAASLQVGLNTSEETSVAYELDYQWYPLDYVGLGIGLELDDDYGNRPLIESEDDDDYDPDRIVKFNIHALVPDTHLMDEQAPQLGLAAALRSGFCTVLPT